MDGPVRWDRDRTSLQRHWHLPKPFAPTILRKSRFCFPLQAPGQSACPPHLSWALATYLALLPTLFQGPLSPASPRAAFASHLGRLISLTSSFCLPQSTLVAEMFFAPPKPCPWDLFWFLTTRSLCLLRRRLFLPLYVPQGLLLPLLNFPHDLTHSK